LTSLVVAGLAVVPARTYLSQRNEAAEAEQELARLRAEVAELDAELRLLETDDAVERIAREHYDLVYPGEESYRILPAAGS
jgi:cell division protein FtsB